MPTKRNISVVLTEQALIDLNPILANWWKKNKLGAPYVNCKSVDPNGPYFTMILEMVTAPEKTLDFEIQIHHHYVRAIVCTTDLKKLGFV